MQLRHKLLTAFLIIILFPCGMVGMIGSIVLAQQVQAIKDGYQINIDSWEIITEPIQILNRMTRGIFNELSTMAERYPERFLEIKRLNKINSSLLERYSYLIIEKNDQVIYVGEEEHYNKIRNQIPSVEIMEVTYDGGVYVEGKYPFLAKQQRFFFASGEEGSFCIITDVSLLVSRLRSATMMAIFIGVMIIVFTASILVVWLYQSMIKPLNELRCATKQLQEGNLDYSLKDAISDDEIGQLCSDFEEMRIHLKEQIEMRIRYEHDLRELISNISHDIKTPLTAIKGYAEGMIDGVADTKEKQEKYLRTIYTKANDMTKLVDELSFYTKIDTNNIPYHFEKVKINDYFMDCVEENQAELEIANIRIEFFSNAEEHIHVMADREQLHRVMNNLIGNAVKYRGDKEEGLIVIHVWDEGAIVRVEVEDNGQGIPEHSLPYIFERFYRADSSRNSGQGGSGLGLAIVKKIIEGHGGNIYAESKVNEGTKIIFTLKKIELGAKKGE